MVSSRLSVLDLREAMMKEESRKKFITSTQKMKKKFYSFLQILNGEGRRGKFMDFCTRNSIKREKQEIT